jgi:hypothetical protein
MDFGRGLLARLKRKMSGLPGVSLMMATYGKRPYSVRRGIERLRTHEDVRKLGLGFSEVGWHES